MTQRNGTQNEKKTFTLSLKARQMKKYPPSKKTLQHALSLLSTCIVNICAIQTNNYKIK